MCDYFWQRMESGRGDLTDVVRSGSRRAASSSSAAEFDPAVPAGWLLPPPEPAVFPPAAAAAAGSPSGNLVESLSRRLRDPLELYDAGAEGMLPPGEEMVVKSPCNDLLRVLQISPGGGGGKLQALPLSPMPRRPCPLGGQPSSSMTAASGSSMAGSVDHGGGVQQISSPRAMGIKRRKSQAKKVVCIPAPIAASSRPSTGEVVPSDLWAWRKYGQKPIKGSPYPRGYYRCSSSKGCSARKQVERSRTDPNMLVITYTSEHNHPWPTQRNALAGSTRSHSSKNAAAAAAFTTASPLPKEESVQAKRNLVKEEDDVDEELLAASKPEEKAAVNQSTPAAEDDELDRILQYQSYYKPMIPGQADDFFAGLAELEADPVSLIFSKNKPGGEEEEQEKAFVDMFDWGGGNTN
ncbi:hypothetical protein Cni_G07758 [Canna indica]|uniref:WRKY domain-containing protein n=1 Tax=Canna indica TaxID=4628 RepID=A0AAQ3JZ87_9LILI|nr:hypothetical protein Cni_G07758 [Canna indica]